MSTTQWKEESSTDAQINRLAAIGLLENRSYTKGEASSLIAQAEEQLKQPDWSLVAEKSDLIQSAIRKSLRSAINRIKKEISSQKTNPGEDQQRANERLAEYEEALAESLENEREEKEFAKEEKQADREHLKEVISVLQFEFGSDGKYGRAFRRPTRKHIEMCVSALDKRQPDWQFISEYPSTDTIAALLAEMFPELLKSQAKKPHTVHHDPDRRSICSPF